MLKAIGGIAFFLLFASFTAASCSPFLTVTVDQQADVVAGADAVYLLQVKNTGSATQSIAVSSQCPGGLSCSFPDAGNPTYVTVGETKLLHLRVVTTGASAGNYSIPIQVFSSIQCVEEPTVRLIVRPSGNSPTPQPGASLAASIAPGEDIATQPGRKLLFTIFIENTLAQAQFISAGSLGNAFASSTVLLPTEFELQPNEKRSIRAELTVPAGTPGGLYDMLFRLRGTSSSGNVYNVDLPVRVFVYASNLFLRFSSLPDSKCLPVFHDGTASREFDLINSGQISGPFTAELRAGDDIYPALELSQTKFEAANGESTALRVTAAPEASLAPGTYYYTLFVRYLDNTALRYDDCIKVKAAIGIAGFSDEVYPVFRGSVTQVRMAVVNNGSIAGDYSLDYNPAPAAGIGLSINPNAFRLAPKQATGLAITVQAGKTAPLGAIRVPLTLRSPNITADFSLNLNVISDNRTSPLQVTDNRFAVFEGSPTQAAVRVVNTGSRRLEAVQLIVEGLPRQWVRVDSGPKDLPAGKEGEFLVTFDIPPGSSQSASKVIPFAIYATSGLESVREDAAIDLFASVRDLQFSVSDVSRTSAGGAVRQVSLQVVLRNAGNVAVKGVRPSLPYSSEYVINTASDLSLGPQQSAAVTITIEPTADSPQQDVLLRFASDDGTQVTKTVKLPAMSATSDNPVFWKVIAIVLLVVAIFAALNRQAE